MADDKGKTVLVAGAVGLSIGALITALARKAEAGEPPTDEEVRQALAIILSQQVNTLDNIADLELKLEALGEATGVIMPKEKKIEQIPFAYNLTIAGTPTSGVVLTEIVPFNGYIKKVTPHWPDGCDALVDIMVGRGVEQFCPREGFLALNDATPEYEFNIPVQQGEEIWVEMRNRDGANPHNITVTISLESA